MPLAAVDKAAQIGKPARGVRAELRIGRIGGEFRKHRMDPYRVDAACGKVGDQPFRTRHKRIARKDVAVVRRKRIYHAKVESRVADGRKRRKRTEAIKKRETRLFLGVARQGVILGKRVFYLKPRLATIVGQLLRETDWRTFRTRYSKLGAEEIVLHESAAQLATA